MYINVTVCIVGKMFVSKFLRNLFIENFLWAGNHTLEKLSSSTIIILMNIFPLMKFPATVCMYVVQVVVVVKADVEGGERQCP